MQVSDQQTGAGRERQPRNEKVPTLRFSELHLSRRSLNMHSEFSASFCNGHHEALAIDESDREPHMTLATRSGPTRSRVALLAMLSLAAIGMAACSGSDGKNGATGPQGPPGGTGETGPTGPTGPTGITIEQGADVAIGDGSTLTADQIKAIGTLVATIDSASIVAPTGATTATPVIEFTVKTSHGGAATGLSSKALYATIVKLLPPSGTAPSLMPARWQSYLNRSIASAYGPKTLPAAVQAQGENQFFNPGTLVETGPGKYRYTYATDLSTVTTPIAVSYDKTLTHRVGIEIRLSGDAEELAPDNPVLDFVPDGSAGSGHKLIAATANCDNCHKRLGLHGGPRRTYEYCVTCHNPGTVDPDAGESLDMAYMAHSLHRGELRGKPMVTSPTAAGFTPAPYEVYGYQGGFFDAGEITYPQSDLFCESCHNGSSAPDGDAWKVNSSASACGGCHVGGLNKTADATTGLYTYTYTHTLLPGYTADDGACAACHVAGQPGGDILAKHKQPPVFASGNRNARYSTERGREFKYEILSVTNAVAGQAPTVTFKVSDKGTPIDVKALTTADGSLTLDFAWNTKDIHTLKDKATGELAGVRGRAVQVNLIANKASVVAVGDGSFSYTASALPAGVDGDVMVALEGRRQFPDNSRAYPDSAIFFPGAPRQALVSQAKCEKCHVQLAIHGGNRSGNPLMCTVCHNSSGGWKAEGFGPIALGAFAHNIHVGKAIGPVTYPQSPRNCLACHDEGTYYAARTDALPISVDAGPDTDPVASGIQNQNLFDDTWSSATAGTCGTCHDSGPAQVHMEQNGGVFEAAGPKALVPSSASESCAVCHSADRIADTAKAHAE
jgi:OmcA/MtrC family decaheme c-type cytochrome